MADLIEELAKAQLYGDKPIKTPIGSILEYLGYPQERLMNVLSSPMGGIMAAQQSGQFYTPPGAMQQTEAQNTLVGALGKILGGLVPYETSMQNMAIGQINPVYHGSPYKFSKFENKAIGTGEGAQAFGYGHYLTESPEVAKQYTKYPKFAETSMGKIDLNKALDNAPIAVRGTMIDVIEGHGNKEAIMDSINKINEFIKTTDPRELKSWSFQSLKDTKILLEDALSGRFKPESHLYEATIHKGKQPSEYTYLEWDKPVSQDLLDKVTTGLKKQGFDLPSPERFLRKDYTQGDLYNSLASNLMKSPGKEGWLIENRQKVASDFFNSIGFSGIKYPTGSLSGMKGTGKYNYVVFNPEDITIEKVK